MTPEKILCIGGPLAGDEIDSKGHYFESDGIAYRYCEINDWFNIYHCFGDDLSALFNTLLYGYEQHCKAVAERNKVPAEQPGDNILLDGVLLKDFYTASFLRSCKTVIIASPFNVPEPLTLSYGKCQYGYLNDAMEFIHKVVMFCDGVNCSSGVQETNLGRIGTPICIVP